MVKLPITLLVLLLVPITPLSAQATGNAGGFGDIKRVWESMIEEDAFALEYKASAVSPQDNSIWLVIGRRPAGMKSGSQALALRGLDNAGKTLSETSLDFITREASFQRPGNDFVGLAAAGDGNLAIVFSLGQVLTVNARSGQVVHRKDIGLRRPDLLVTRALSLSGGGLLLIGRIGVRATAIKLNPSLEVVWEKSTGSAVVFFDGAVCENESSFLAGDVLHGRSTAASLWVGQFSSSGEVVNSLSLPGQLLSIATTPSGGCAIVQGIRGSLGVDFWFRNYDRDLKELWNVQLGSGIGAVWPFLVSHIPGTRDDYLIVGIQGLKFSLFRVNAGSSIVWTHTLQGQFSSIPALEMIWNFGLLPTRQSIVIPFTDLVVNSKMQEREIVKIMSLDTGD